MDELKEEWDGAALKIDWDPMRPLRYGMAGRYLKELDRDLSLLEIGCGEGTGLNVFNMLGFSRLTGVEVSAERLRRAAEKAPAGAVLKEIDADSSLPFCDGSFGVVVSLAVIEHVVSVQRYLSEIYRVLAPDGWGVIGSDCLSWNFMQMLKLHKSDQPIDWALAAGTLERLFEEAGFTVLHFDTFNLPGRGCPMVNSAKSIVGKLLYGRDENKCFERYPKTNNLSTAVAEARKVSESGVDYSPLYRLKKRVRNLVDDENIFLVRKRS